MKYILNQVKIVHHACPPKQSTTQPDFYTANQTQTAEIAKIAEDLHTEVKGLEESIGTGASSECEPDVTDKSTYSKIDRNGCKDPKHQ